MWKVPEAYIIEALNWLNIPYDEGPGKEAEICGPFRQSERKRALAGQYADALIESGNAYYAFDTAEELDAHRKDHEEKRENLYLQLAQPFKTEKFLGFF